MNLPKFYFQVPWSANTEHWSSNIANLKSSPWYAQFLLFLKDSSEIGLSGIAEIVHDDILNRSKILCACLFLRTKMSLKQPIRSVY